MKKVVNCDIPTFEEAWDNFISKDKKDEQDYKDAFEDKRGYHYKGVYYEDDQIVIN